MASDSRWRSATFTIATWPDRLERVAQQHVRFRALGVGLQEVGLGEVDGVDLLDGVNWRTSMRRELDSGQVGEVVVGQHDHVAGGQFVALGDVGVGDLLAVDRADALVADAPAVLAVHLVEGDVLLLGRRVELDRIVTSPNEMAPFQMLRIATFSSRVRITPCRGARFKGLT